MKPIPLQVLHSISCIAQQATHPHVKATADKIILVFFFLLRPGEYRATASDTEPFDFQSGQLFIGPLRINLTSAPDAEIHTATFASLAFDLQKDGVRGEVVGLGCSGHQYVCPVRALARRIIHIRQSRAPPTTPLRRSDTMLRYRMVQSSTHIADYASRMLHNGDYVLVPNQLVPMH